MITTITKRFVVLLLAVAFFAASGWTQAHAAESAPKKVYEVTWSDEDLSTPMSWVQSSYYNNPQYKETRFEDYNNNAPIPPGGPRETSFYMAYKADGLYMFFQSNEAQTDENGTPLASSLEMFVAPGEGDLPYSQVIVPTTGTDIEYYEWQTEYRDHRPLQGKIRIDSKPIPDGWGTVVVIPWEAVYDKVPLNGENWQFNVIRWSPSDGRTWGGQVHQPGRFNLLHFQTPTADQRMAVQKYVASKAWNQFKTTSTQLTQFWLTNRNTADNVFYLKGVLPYITEGTAAGIQMFRLNQMNQTETEKVYKHVPKWMELRYNVDDQRRNYLKKQLING